VPKALVEAGGRPLLEHSLRRFSRLGIQSLAVNAHYLSEQIQSYQRCSAIPFELFYESEIRGTGGALDFARPFLSGDDRFCVCNADILSNVDLARWRGEFEQDDAVAALIAAPARASGSIWMHAESGRFAGIHGRALAPAGQCTGADFIGMALYRREFLDAVEPEDFSITPVWERLIRRGANIKVYVQHDCRWFDCGAPRSLATVHFAVLDQRFAIDYADGYVHDTNRKRAYPAGCAPETLAALGEYCWTDTAEISPDADIARSVVFRGVHISAGRVIRDALVTPWGSVSIEP
jgi:NDP-sugar pyrophosphorylase family protein